MADNIDIHEAAKADAPALTSAQRIKRALANGKKERISKNASNKIMLGVFRVAAAITTLVLVAIIAYVVINGLPHVSPAFIFTWPHGVNAEGGIWPTIVSTVYVTALAMLICTPIAVLAAVYLAEYAKHPRKAPAAVRAPRRRPRQPLRAVLRHRPQPRGPVEKPISTLCSLCPAPFKAGRGSFAFYFCLFTPV